MKRPSLILVAAVFASLLPQFSEAQDSKKKEKKKRPAPVVSPIVGENGVVTFQIKAPKANVVSVSGEMAKGKLELTLNEETGIWSGTLNEVVPGIYGYSFNIDGVQQVDSGNPALKPMRSPKTSVLHISGGNVFDFDPAIEHGTVHTHGYFSKPINRYREMRVYTPPGYETGDDKYPLLVLQHGHSDGGETWTDYGKAQWILDNLIASGKAKPMTVVMLDGHPIPKSYGNGRSEENTEELRLDLMDAALPMVEKLYRVKQGSENRAIAGLSMGGLHSLTIGLNELETFSYVGAFSAAPPEKASIEAAFSNVEDTNARLKLLWIACGKDDFLLKENERAIGEFTEAGIKHEWVLTEGGHSWPVWRGYLADFAPLLFK